MKQIRESTAKILKDVKSDDDLIERLKKTLSKITLMDTAYFDKHKTIMMKWLMECLEDLEITTTLTKLYLSAFQEVENGSIYADNMINEVLIVISTCAINQESKDLYCVDGIPYSKWCSQFSNVIKEKIL